MHKMAIASVTVLALMLFGCNKAYDSESALSDNQIGRSISAKITELDAPRNPYVGQYSKWDAPVHEALVDAQQKGRLGDLRPAQGGWAKETDIDHHVFDAYIDPQGNMVPKLLLTRRMEEALKSDQPIAGVFTGLDHFVVTVKMSQADYDSFYVAADKIVASYFPQIPQWLYEQIPEGGVQLYPNGDIVCHGALGTWKPEAEHETHEPSHAEDRDEHPTNLYLYDSAGRLKATATQPSPLTLYLDEDQFPPNAYVDGTKDGYTIFYDNLDRSKVIAIYDFDGTKLKDAKLPLPKRDMHRFVRMVPHLIERVYKAQHGVPRGKLVVTIGSGHHCLYSSRISRTALASVSGV